jgi:uncharacterized protein
LTKTNPLKEAFIFLGITLGLSYFVFWGPLAIFKIPAISFVGNTRGPIWAIALYILGGFVPSLTALILTWIKEGRIGLRKIWQRMIQFKIGWRWYLAAVLVVILGTTGQLVIQRLLGHSFNGTLFITQLASFLPLLILGPLSEEIGWRGYALDRLQTKWNPLVSSLIVGLVWGLWHLPLFYMVGTSQNLLGMPFIGFVVGVMATSVVYTWLHNNTGGSLWTAIFFHWLYTYSAQVVATGVTRSKPYNWLEYTPYVLIAVIVIIIWKPQKVTSKFAIPAQE